MKTIKQIADALEVDKQRVYRYIKKNHINEAHHKNGVMYYDDKAQTLIQNYFSEDKIEASTSGKSIASASYDVLLKQSELFAKELDIKNEQIRELNLRLSEMAVALVAAQQSAHAAQALHAGTMQKQLTDGATDPSEPTASSRGFFGKMFGRKKSPPESKEWTAYP